MQDIRPILERFPERELEIRRLCARDADFRSVCADYAEAAKALRRWRVVDGGGRAREYRNFLAELEEEILERLQRPVRSATRSEWRPSTPKNWR